VRADLHIHSTASDGQLTPEEIVCSAVNKGLEVISITDHDSVSGLPRAIEAAKSFPHLQFIPGVEVATDASWGELHILGYFIDYTHPQLLKTLEWQRRSREERVLKIIAKLKEMGIEVALERVRQLAKGESLGRPHIAQAMVETGYIPSLRAAFLKYIGRGRPAYVPRKKVSPEEMIRLIIKVGGIPVVAHPPLNIEERELEQLLFHFKKEGLMGLEAYYNGYPPHRKQRLAELAHGLGLIVTGGSDYHGLEGIDTPIGGVEIPLTDIDSLLTSSKRRVYVPR